MPRFKVRDRESGQTLTLVGDSPPTEQEIEEIFSSLRPQGPPAPAFSPTQEPQIQIPQAPVVAPLEVTPETGPIRMRFVPSELPPSEFGEQPPVLTPATVREQNLARAAAIGAQQPFNPMKAVKGLGVGAASVAAATAGGMEKLAAPPTPKPVSFGRHEAEMLLASRPQEWPKLNLQTGQYEGPSPELRAKTRFSELHEESKEKAVTRRLFKTLSGTAESMRQAAEKEAGTDYGAGELIGSLGAYSALAAIPVVGAPAAIGAGGLSSYNDTFIAAKEAFLSQGMGEKEAEKKASQVATISGLTTGVIFSKLPGKQAANAAVLNALKNAKPAVRKAAELLAQSGQGGIVMGANSLLQSAIGKYSFDPEIEWDEALMQAATETLAGAAGVAVTHGAVKAATGGAEALHGARVFLARQTPETRRLFEMLRERHVLQATLPEQVFERTQAWDDRTRPEVASPISMALGAERAAAGTPRPSFEEPGPTETRNIRPTARRLSRGPQRPIEPGSMTRELPENEAYRLREELRSRGYPDEEIRDLSLVQLRMLTLPERLPSQGTIGGVPPEIERKYATPEGQQPQGNAGELPRTATRQDVRENPPEVRQGAGKRPDDSNRPQPSPGKEAAAEPLRIAEEIGWTLSPTPQFAGIRTEGLSAQDLATLEATMPRQLEFTDRRIGSPTEGMTFYAPEGATRQQIIDAYRAKVAEVERGQRQRDLTETMAEVRRRIVNREELDATIAEIRNRITQRESGKMPQRPAMPEPEEIDAIMAQHPEENPIRLINEPFERWERDVEYWEGNLPKNRPILLQNPETDTPSGKRRGGIHAVTRDPMGGWRATYFVWNRDQTALMPWGHQVYKTRAEAVIDVARSNGDATVVDRLPGRVMDEREIKDKRELAGAIAQIQRQLEQEAASRVPMRLTSGQQGGSIPPNNQPAAAETITVRNAAEAAPMGPGTRSNEEQRGSVMTAEGGSIPPRAAAVIATDLRNAKARVKLLEDRLKRLSRIERSPATERLNRQLQAAKQRVTELLGEKSRKESARQRRGRSGPMRTGLTPDDGMLFDIASKGPKVPMFMPPGWQVSQYLRLLHRVQAGGMGDLSTNERDQFRRLQEIFPDNYEDDFGLNGEAAKSAYEAAQRAGIAYELFAVTQNGRNMRFDLVKDALGIDNGVDIFNEIERLSEHKRLRDAGEIGEAAEGREAELDVKREARFKHDIKRATPGTVPLSRDKLVEGATFTLKGARMRVTRVIRDADQDGEVVEVELDDGERYGVRRIDEQVLLRRLRMDEGSLKLPKSAEAEADWLTPEVENEEPVPPEAPAEESPAPTAPAPKLKTSGPAVDLFGNPIEPEPAAPAEPAAPVARQEGLGLDLSQPEAPPAAQERSLTKEERKELRGLVLKLRQQREGSGPALTFEETQRYEQLGALAGQKAFGFTEQQTEKEAIKGQLKALVAQWKALNDRRPAGRGKRYEQWSNDRNALDRKIRTLRSQLTEGEGQSVGRTWPPEEAANGYFTSREFRVRKLTPEEINERFPSPEERMNLFNNYGTLENIWVAESRRVDYDDAFGTSLVEKGDWYIDAWGTSADGVIAEAKALNHRGWDQMPDKVPEPEKKGAPNAEEKGQGQGLQEVAPEPESKPEEQPPPAPPAPPEPPAAEAPAPAAPPVAPVKGLTPAESQRLAELTDKIESGKKLTAAEQKRYRKLVEKLEGHEPEQEGGVKSGDEERNLSLGPESGTRVNTKSGGAILTPPSEGMRRNLFPSYHGTPHDITDRFSTSKIGTGEGAQVYGWGIYLAQRLEVADTYRRSLAKGTVPSSAHERFPERQTMDAKSLGELAVSHPLVIEDFRSADVETRTRMLSVMRGLFQDREIGRAVVRLVPVDVMNALTGGKFATDDLLHNPSVLINLFPVDANDSVASRVKAINKLAPYLTRAIAEHPSAPAELRGILRDWFSASGTRVSDFHVSDKIPYPREEVNTGNLYTVDIADDSVLLDWDKTIPPETIQRIARAADAKGNRYWQGKPSTFMDELERAAVETAERHAAMKVGAPESSATGESVYRTLEGIFGAREASKLLQSLGIHGTRYLDQGSRGQWWGDIEFTKDGYVATIGRGQPGVKQQKVFKTRAEAQAFLDNPPETHNFVIWDESKIRITEKNGKPVSLEQFRNAQFGDSRRAVTLGKDIALNTPEEIRKAIRDPKLSITEDHRKVLDWMVRSGLMEKLPGLRLEITDFIRGGAQGSYQQGLIKFLRWASAETPVHEFFHHLHRFLSAEDRQYIREYRLQAIRDKIAALEHGEKAKPGSASGWESMDVVAHSDKEIIGQLKKLLTDQLPSDYFAKLDFDTTLYHLSNEFEFFTWLMTGRAMKEINRPEARTFVAKVRGYIQEIWKAFKDAFGVGKQKYEDVLFREIISGKYEFLREDGERFEKRMRDLNLPLDPKEYERKKLFGDVGTQAGTVGGYRTIAERQRALADSMGISERGRAMAGLNRNATMTELALAEPGGKTTYAEARDTAGTDGERMEVVRDAYEKVVRNQFHTMRLRKKLAAATAEITSEKFRDSIVRASEARDKADLKEWTKRQFVMHVSAAAGRIANQLNKLVATGAAVDQLKDDLARVEKLRDYSTAVANRMEDIVQTLAMNDAGVTMLLAGGARDGSDIAAAYREAFPPGSRPQQGSDMWAYINLASSVLAANRDLRNQLTSYALIQQDTMLGTEVNAVGFKIASDIVKHPAEAIQRLARRSASLADRATRAEAAWMAINRPIQKKLAQWQALDDAVRLQEALASDPTYRGHINEVLTDNWPKGGGDYLVPDEVLERMQAEYEADTSKVAPPMQRVFFDFAGKQRLISPTGKTFSIDMGWKPDTVQESQVELAHYVNEVNEWLADPSNANHPSRRYWEERLGMVESVLMSSAVWNPGAVRFAIGRGGWGMPEVFYQGLALPQAKVAFIAQKNFDRLWTQAKGWYMESYDPIRSLVRQARKSHGYDELDAQDYRIAILNNLAWEFRNGRHISVGDIVNGHKITAEDMRLLEGMGRSFSSLYEKMQQSRKISGAEAVMEFPRLLDEFTGGAWGIRKAMEIGIRKGTTLPRRFSRHGAALAQAIHSILERRATELERLPREAANLTPEEMNMRRELIDQKFYGEVDFLLNDPEKIRNFVYAFMRQRNSQIYKTPSPYEEHYKEITELVSNESPDAPRTMAELVDFIEQRVEAEEAPKVKKQLYGEIIDLTERFFKLTGKDSNQIQKGGGQLSTRETSFTHAMTHDVGPAYFYDFGGITAGEVRHYATDMSLFAWRGVERAMYALRNDMVDAISRITDVSKAFRRGQMEENKLDYRTGKDFRDLQHLEDRLLELDRFINRLGVWADIRAVGAEGIGLKLSARLMGDAVLAALSGSRTVWRISGAIAGGSAVKMSNVLLQLGMGRMRSFPVALSSAVLSMMRFGTGFAFGWYVPGEGVKLGLPARLIANVPQTVRAVRKAKGSERIAQGIEALFANAVDEQFAALRYWFDQKLLGMTPDTPLSSKIANILDEPLTRGGVFNVKRRETAAGRAWQKTAEWLFYRPLSLGEAGLTAISTRFPTAGYNVTYDSVGRMATWYLDLLATHARRTFDTYEKLGRLDRFNFTNIHDPKNKLAPWEALPTFWSRIGINAEKLPAWARPNSTNLQLARELFSSSTDVDLQDLMIRYWSRLAQTAPEQRHNVSFLAPEEVDATRAQDRAAARARGIISRFVEQTHHAVPSNRSFYLQKAFAFQAFMPFAGWTMQTLKQIPVYLGKAVASASDKEGRPFDSHAGMLAAAMATAVIVGLYSFTGGDLEVRGLRLWDRYVNHKVSTLKTIDEAQGKVEAAEILVHNMTSWMPTINSAINTIVGSTAYRGQYGFQAFALDKVNALLGYVRGVLKTHDLTYGLERLAIAQIPFTEPMIENLFQRQGYQNARNSVRSLQKTGPEDLVARRASASISLPTELTPARLELNEAIFSGRQDLVAKKYAAFIAKAAEIGRAEPESIAKQTFSTMNPYRQAFGTLLTSQQRAHTIGRLGAWEKSVVQKAERNYAAAAATLGLNASFTKEESEGTPTRSTSTRPAVRAPAIGTGSGGEVRSPSASLGTGIRTGGLSRRVSMGGMGGLGPFPTAVRGSRILSRGASIRRRATKRLPKLKSFARSRRSAGIRAPRNILALSRPSKRRLTRFA